jgi:hypothetical protein
LYILGINAYYGDAATAIVRDGGLIAAVEEERVNHQAPGNGALVLVPSARTMSMPGCGYYRDDV